MNNYYPYLLGLELSESKIATYTNETFLPLKYRRVNAYYDWLLLLLDLKN